jgi:hypothetical protein
MKKKTKKIITCIVLIILTLAIILVLISKTCLDCWGWGTKNIVTIDKPLEYKINNLLTEMDTKLIVGLEKDKTIITEQGFENFGVPIAFSPTDPASWGIDNTRCEYTIGLVNQAGYCINAGWESADEDIVTGMNNVQFDKVENNIGYALIKINIPEDLNPCLQRFKITVKCTFATEVTTDYFDLKIVKKGL